MFNKNIKLVLAIAALALATWQYADDEIGNGIMFTLLAGMFTLLYFKNEIIIATMFKMKRQDMEGAQNMLTKIKSPETALTKKQQGYWNFLKGQFEFQSAPMKAEKYLRKAITLGLNFDHDLAAAKMFLAGIVASKNRKEIRMLPPATHNKFSGPFNRSISTETLRPPTTIRAIKPEIIRGKRRFI